MGFPDKLFWFEGCKVNELNLLLTTVGYMSFSSCVTARHSLKQGISEDMHNDFTNSFGNVNIWYYKIKSPSLHT